MVRRSRPCCDKNGLKKGTWTPEEDRKLVAYVTRYGTWNWRQLPKFAGLSRCGKSCRLRWMNYLRPNLKRGKFSKEEEEKIIKLHQSLGNRWSAIAAELSGRTDNEIKNHWHTYLKKILGQASISKEQEQRKKRRFKNKITKEKTSEVETTFAVEPSSQQILESSECVPPPPPPPPPSMEQLSSTMEKRQLNCTTFITKSDLPSPETFFETTTSFWTEPFLRDDYDLSPIVDTEYLYPSSPFFIEELLCSYYGSFNECDTECQNFTID